MKFTLTLSDTTTGIFATIDSNVNGVTDNKDVSLSFLVMANLCSQLRNAAEGRLINVETSPCGHNRLVVRLS